MLGTELTYVREKLKRCTPAELAEAVKVADVHPKTLQRIIERKTKNPSAMTVGKLAIHFRTREKRAQ